MPRRSAATGPLQAVFVRIGWMDYYDLRKEPNGPVRGGSFNTDQIGSEAENFHAFRGRVYGFVQIGRQRAFNLTRLGRSPRRPDVTGLLVLMFATPEAGGQRLVGWYANAACFAEYQSRPRLYGGYNFETAARNAVLLPLPQRTFEAPNRHGGGFGQSSVRYARAEDGSPAVLPWMRKAVAWVGKYRGPNLLDGGDPGELPNPRTQGMPRDAAARRAVEERAMRLAIEFFESRGYRVQDVHRTHSYDLWCVRNSESLRVEVKGSTHDIESVFVTRNEVRSARDRGEKTALFVVRDIELRLRKDRWTAAGGAAVWVPDWRPGAGDLDPIQYQCRLPNGMRGATPRKRR